MSLELTKEYPLTEIAASESDGQLILSGEVEKLLVKLLPFIGFNVFSGLNIVITT